MVKYLKRREYLAAQIIDLEVSFSEWTLLTRRIVWEDTFLKFWSLETPIFDHRQKGSETGTA
jgi:hypothetical protein